MIVQEQVKQLLRVIADELDQISDGSNHGTYDGLIRDVIAFAEDLRTADWGVKENPVKYSLDWWCSCGNDGSKLLPFIDQPELCIGCQIEKTIIEKYGTTGTIHLSQAIYIQARNLAIQEETIKSLKREIELLRLYGNKDCTAMADETLEIERNPTEIMEYT